MPRPYQILILEDYASDAELMVIELRRSGLDFEWQRVDSEAEYLTQLEAGVDVILADYSLPQFDAPRALQLLQERELDIPFIVVTGAVGDEAAVRCMKQGAADYLLKDRLGRLGTAVLQALKQKRLRDEKEQTEQALLQSQKLESLAVLAGGVAHDFNNLLVAILGQTSLAKAKLPADSDARKNIDKAIKAAERAADLTRQMLAYSGRGQFEVQLVSLNSLISLNLHLFEAAVPKNVRVRAQLYQSLPPIEADIGQIQQVVMNLILNAAEAIGNQPGTVVVTTNTCNVDSSDVDFWQRTGGDALKPGAYVSLEVHDDGCGMDADTLSKIFDPFFTTKFTGRGLGLAAVLGIVRGHKAGLRVESKRGEGTTFKLIFPASNRRATKPVTPVVVPDTQIGAVLVIDDEEPVREAVTDILEEEGFEVISAVDGQAGIESYTARAADIQLVILDLSMPGMNGAETFRELQRINPHVRVILSSGYSKDEATRHIARNRLVDFLQKPYDVTTLVSVIQRHMPSTDNSIIRK